MVKAFSIALFCTVLEASEIDEKIKNIIGQSRFGMHKNLISLIFKDKDSFYEQGMPNIHKIVNELKENGILDLSKNPNGEIDLHFNVQKSPIFLVKAVNDTLKNMGYGYFITKKSALSERGFEWSVNIKSELKPDIAIMLNELSKWGCRVIDIKEMGQNGLYYTIKIDEPKIPSAKQIFRGTQIDSDRTLDDYWFEIKESGTVSFASKDGGVWYPNIIFYDSSLSMLDSITSKNGVKKIDAALPQWTRFILITDSFTPTNIKNGIKATLY